MRAGDSAAWNKSCAEKSVAFLSRSEELRYDYHDLAETSKNRSGYQVIIVIITNNSVLSGLE